MRTYYLLKSELKSFASIPLFFLRSSNFCIWHSGRCGSTILSSMLEQHPKIYCGKELLERYSRGYQKLTDKSKAWSGAKWRIRLNKLKGGPVVSGFEMKIWHLVRLGVSVSEAMTFLNQLNYNKHIVLERQNYLRVIVSGKIATSTLNYHINSQSQPSLNKVHLSPEVVKSSLSDYTNFYTELKSLLGENCLWLVYEKDILQDPSIAFQKVTDFLQLNPVKAEIFLGRTNPFSLEDLILNFDEIASLLEGTPYEWMLKDPL